NLLALDYVKVTLEDEKILVIRSNGKRKRDEGEEEGCKYLRLERKLLAPLRFTRKFRLPEDSNPLGITAKCEDGVLTVVVEKLPPPPEVKKLAVVVD
ncbi:17.4 kDa class III heat shock protein-like, partial [Phalaenopsis equestris]|uniref:17.4 kDa class III heat shock protein-like n=1 Tax=Phalaenopsis equestris TaxID=78828 RepID=UPI0009E5D270